MVEFSRAHLCKHAPAPSKDQGPFALYFSIFTYHTLSYTHAQREREREREAQRLDLSFRFRRKVYTTPLEFSGRQLIPWTSQGFPSYISLCNLWIDLILGALLPPPRGATWRTRSTRRSCTSSRG